MIYNKLISYLSVLVLFAFTLFAQDTTNQEEREKILKEYQEISSRLMDLQKQALSVPEIAEQAEDFSQHLENAMLKEDPSLVEKMNRRDEIINNFEEADKVGDKNKVIQLQQEYQEITQELMTHQQNALENNTELREEGENLEEALFKKMKEIDPEVPDLVARLETLGNRIQGLEGDKQL
jgi:chromosome condensin MukBEF ATPase and DNA-binding subunit MukB